MRVGSLFSGIGGLDLGLERAGMTVVWQAENEPYASKVLRKHWPDVPNLGDVTEVDWDALLADSAGGRRERSRRAGSRPSGFAESEIAPHSQAWLRTVDLVCGGFPCQDLSFAGRGGGITPGSRSGLWTEFARCVRALRPRYVLVENVPALLVRRPGMDVVAADLAALGYDLWWDCIPAAAVGAPHRRDRVWIVAYADTSGRNGWSGNGRQGRWREPTNGGQWATEPDVGRVAHGIPHRVDRLRCLGNAVVPQVAELIGRAILEADAA